MEYSRSLLYKYVIKSTAKSRRQIVTDNEGKLRYFNNMGK